MYCVDASSPPHVQERDFPTANSFSTGEMLSLVQPLAGMTEPSNKVMAGQDEIDVHTASVWGWGVVRIRSRSDEPCHGHTQCSEYLTVDLTVVISHHIQSHTLSSGKSKFR